MGTHDVAGGVPDGSEEDGGVDEVPGDVRDEVVRLVELLKSVGVTLFIHIQETTQQLGWLAYLGIV